MRELIRAEKRLVVAKDGMISMMRTKIIQLEEDLWRGEAKSRAAAGSRIVLEAGIYRYSNAIGSSSGAPMTEQFRVKAFCENCLMDARTTKLNAESKGYLSDLTPFGLEVKEADVVRGLKTLVHNLSKAHHYLRVVAGSLEWML